MVLMALAAALYLSAHVGVACTCVQFTPESAFQSADAVFVGRVIDKGWFNPYVEFRVEKAWKGVIADEVTVYIEDQCGPLNFTSGESYLVYAYRAQGDYLYTTVCTKTSRLVDAEEQLIYLEGKSPVLVAKKFWNRNMRIGLITGAFILGFLGIGYVVMRIKKRAV